MLLSKFNVANSTENNRNISVRLLTRSSDNVPLCALDPPSFNISLTDDDTKLSLQTQFHAHCAARGIYPATNIAGAVLQLLLSLTDASPMRGAPPAVRCAMLCTQHVDCQQFNYITTDHCQLYNFTPTNFQPIDNCQHYGDPGRTQTGSAH